MRIRISISLFFLVFAFLKTNAQTYNYSYTDPCTGNIKNLIVPINGTVTVGYYGFIGNFSQQDFSNGNFESWANNIFSQYNGSPCSEIIGLGGQINMAQDVALNTISIINSLSSLMDLSNGATDFLSGTLTAASNSSNTREKKGDKKNNNGGNANSQQTASGTVNSGTNAGGSTNNAGSSNSNLNPNNNSETSTSNSTGTNSNSGGISNSTAANNQNGTNGTGNTNGGNQATSGSNEGGSNNGGIGTSGSNAGAQGETPTGSNAAQNGSNENGNTQTLPSVNNQNSNTNGTNINSTVNNNPSGSVGNGNMGSSTSGQGEKGETNQGITNGNPTPAPTNSTNSNSNSGGNSNSGSPNENGNTTNSEETTKPQEEQGGQTNITQGATKTINQNKDGGKPTVIASSDFVGFNFQNSEVRTGLKLTGGYHNMRWDGETARGGLLDYVSAQKGPNLTGYHAWINKKSVGLLSGTLSVGFEGRGSIYGTLAGGQMFMFPKIPSLKAVYMGTISYGQVYKTPFLGSALIAGGMYDLKFGRRIDVKLMALFVYSPYVSYYNDLVLKSPYVVLPSLGTNISITKRFKFNINAGGAWAIKVNTLNYTITCGTRLLVGQ